EIIQHLSTAYTRAARTAHVGKRARVRVIGCDRQPFTIAALERCLKRVVIADAIGLQQLNGVHERNLSIVRLARTGKRYNRRCATTTGSERRQVGIEVRNSPAEMAYGFANITNTHDITSEFFLEREVVHVHKSVAIAELGRSVHRETADRLSGAAGRNQTS